MPRMLETGSLLPASPQIRTFFVTALALDAGSVAVELLLKFVAHMHWPYVFPLLNDIPGGDMTVFPLRFAHVHSPAFFEASGESLFVYPAAVAPVYGFFYHFRQPALALQVFVMLCVIGGAVAVGLALTRRAGVSTRQAWCMMVGVICLSYPLAFELKQCNTEIAVVVLVAAGIWAFTRERYQWAAVLFGVAGAMKIFPFIYLGLFLSRRRFLPIVTSAAAAALTTLASLYYLSPSIGFAWRGINESLHSFQLVTLRFAHEIGSDHSAFAFLKMLYLTLHLKTDPSAMAQLMRWYLPVAALSGIVLYFVRIRKLPLINQVLCLVVASILLPPSSYDYTLLHLYAPWVMLIFLALQSRDRRVPGLFAAFSCLAVLTSIQTPFILHGHVLAGQLKCLVLMVLWWVASTYEFQPEPRLEEIASAETGVRPLADRS